MCLFLEVNDRGDAEEALVQARSAQASRGVRLLKHWLGADGVVLLVEAPDEQTLRACSSGAKEITELFAPAERWMSYDSIEMA